MTREQLLSKKRGLEIQRDTAKAQLDSALGQFNFAQGALTFLNDLLQEFDRVEQPQETGEQKENKDG